MVGDPLRLQNDLLRKDHRKFHGSRNSQNIRPGVVLISENLCYLPAGILVAVPVVSDLGDDLVPVFCTFRLVEGHDQYQVKFRIIRDHPAFPLLSEIGADDRTGPSLDDLVDCPLAAFPVPAYQEAPEHGILVHCSVRVPGRDENIFLILPAFRGNETESAGR